MAAMPHSKMRSGSSTALANLFLKAVANLLGKSSRATKFLVRVEEVKDLTTQDHEVWLITCLELNLHVFDLLHHL